MNELRNLYIFGAQQLRYKTYIFDFDYTLADATTGIVESVNYALNMLGLKSESCESIRKTVGMKLHDTFFTLTGISDEKEAEAFFSHFMHKADEVMTNNTFLFNDTIPTLTRLKQSGCNIAIVTTKFRYRINEVLIKHDITELIDYIVGYEDVNDVKPSPEGLLKAIKHFNNDKKSVLFIGDNLIDAQTAYNANVDFIAVITGTTLANDFLALPHIFIAKNLFDAVDNTIPTV